MKSKFLRYLPVIAGCLFLVTGCPTETGDPSGTGISPGGGGGNTPALGTELRFYSDDVQKDPVRYFSLATGDEVPAGQANTTNWDIAVVYDGFIQVYTNSGNSGPGNGGVTFTGKTDFDTVVLADGVTDFSGANAEYAFYTKDVTRWVGTMTSKSETVMNIMTYLGYISGDGTEGSPFSPSPFVMNDPDKKMYEFNKKQCYDHRGGTMAPLYDPTYQVYIVTHADGTAKSKFQLSGVTVTYQKGAISRLYADMRFKYGALE
jgi:hypothetical protein